MKWNKLPKKAKVKIEDAIFIVEGYNKSRIMLRTPDKTIGVSLSDSTEFKKKGDHYELVESNVFLMVDTVDSAETRAFRLYSLILFVVRLLLMATIIAGVWRYMGWV